jgi:hypothetical protein
VLIAPCLPPGTEDATVYEHSAIPRSLRELFAPHLPALTARDHFAESFWRNLSLDAPRPAPAIVAVPEPDAAPATVASTSAARVRAASEQLAAPPRPLDAFQQSLVELTVLVDQALRAERKLGRAVSAARDSATTPALVEAAGAATAATRVFVTEAERQLYLQDVTRRFQKAPSA